MVLNDLLTKVEKLNNKDYWFVRTDSGQHFDTFLNNNFIGIGWNGITLNDLSRLSETEIKLKIASLENIDLSKSSGKGKVSSILNKIKTFQQFSKGDIVVIPSESSSKLAFGTIEDSQIYVEANPNPDCEYYKRRRVKWLEVEHIESLDPTFYKIKVSRHAISNIKKYENYIDNVTNNVYLKSGHGHLVLDIKTTNDINVDALLSLIENIQKLSISINNDFNLNEDIEGTSIKLNLQSPGKLELKRLGGATLILLALILGGCSAEQASGFSSDVPNYEQFLEVHEDTILAINSAMDTLQVDTRPLRELK